MSALHITPVDPADPIGFAAYYEVYAAASLHGPQGEFSTPWQLEEARVALQDEDARTFRVAWAGRVGGRVVVSAWLEGSLVDNTELGVVRVFSAPAERGRGHAVAMLEHAEAEARRRGLTRLVAEVVWPYDGGVDGTGSAELAWARRRGFELALVDVQRRLALPVPDAVLDELAAEAARHHEGYQLRSFLGPVPEDLVEGWAELTASIDTEAPTGDIHRDSTTVEVAAVRAMEALVEKQGRQKINTVAIAPDGEVVAYTDIAITVHEADRAYQWGTLVRSDHRGHRLGLAVKVANLRLLQRAHPQLTTLVTFNADVNAPMVSVNDRLGFVPVQWMGELQKRIEIS